MSMISWIASKPINTQRVNELIQQSVSKNQFTNYGPNVALLEHTIRRLLQVDANKAVVVVSNGAVALWAAVAAMTLQRDPAAAKPLRFATQAFTFPPSAQGVMGDSIIVDIDEGGGPCLADLEKCKHAIDGVVVTNLFGHVVDVQKYEVWCRENNKFLMFDNAACAASFYKGSNSVNGGHAATVSFHHTKPIGFGEGGCVIIDKAFEADLRRIINFGIDNGAANPSWHRLGSNYKLSDIGAVYIQQYLDRFEEITAHHKRLYEHMQSHCQRLGIQMMPHHGSGTPFVSCIPLFVPKSEAVIERLMNAGVYCRKYYKPLEWLPKAAEWYDAIVCLPCHLDMTVADIDRIAGILSE